MICAAQAKYISWTQECQGAYFYGVGAVLAQLEDAYWHPVAYFSKHLSKQERNYSTSEKELFAIVLAMEHFRQFLYGVQFVVITDHQPLKYILK